MRARIPGACIAARFSTENQDDDSIEIQIKKCTEYCNAHHIPILDVYPDYAVSGMKSHRTQLDRLMEDLRAGRGDTVIVLDQSRLIRNMPSWFTLRNEIASMGVRLISVTEPYVGGDMRDPNTFLMESQKAMFNHMYVLFVRQKVLAKMRHMAQNGQHTGGKPALGYKVESDGEKKRLVIDEEEAAVVRRIFREYDEGRSYKQIIDGLNADGIRTKRGSAFGANSLHDLLHNEKYIGTIVYGSKVYRPDGSRNTHDPEGTDVVRIENAIPAIIDKDQFDRVQQRMTYNKHAQGGRPSERREYPLRGKVFCGECGAGMHVRTSKGGYFYYACNSKKNKHEPCGNKPIRVDVLEDMVSKYVSAIVGNPEVLQETMDRIRASVGDLQQTGASRLQALIDESYDIDAKLSRIVEAIENGMISQTLTARLKDLEARKAKTQQSMEDLRRAMEVASLPEKHMQSLFDFIVTSAKADPMAIYSIVTRVEIFRDRIIIYTSFDPDPSGRPLENPEKVIETPGTPSGVPIVFITAIGLGIVVKR